MIETKGIIVLIDCYECKAKVSDSAASCPHCGAIPADPTQSLPVEVADFDMRFGSMFWVLIKLSFAAVPAVIVIYTAWTIIGGVMNPLLHM
ncbi:MAG: hypothetical protein M0P95_07440 [Sulfuritalea sp.]|jgi:hypothetical protein|nr:hypothetical protein [Sulfuritalea sp.]